MSENRRLIRNTIIITIGNISAKILSFLLLPLYTSLLSPAKYGVFDYITAVGMFLAPVITLSIHQAMFRFMLDKDDEEGYRQVISHSFVVFLGGHAVYIAIMFFLSVFTNIPHLWFIFLYSISACIISYFLSILRGLSRIKQYSIISCISTFLQLLFNILLVAVFRTGIIGLVVAFCLSNIVVSIIIIIQVRFWRLVNFQTINRQFLVGMLRYALPLVPSNVSSMMVQFADRIVIVNTSGDTANGIYAISNKFPSIIEVFYHNFNIAWSESASRLVGSDSSSDYYIHMNKLLQRLIFSVMLVLTSAMPILFRLLVNREYVDAFPYVPSLMLGMFFYIMSCFLSGIFIALKNTKIISIATVAGAAVNLIFNILFIPHYGLYAATSTTLVGYFIMFLIQRVYILHYIRWQDDWFFLLLSFGIGTIIYWLYDYSSFWKTLLSLILSFGFTLFTNQEVIKSLYLKIRNKLQQGNR